MRMIYERSAAVDVGKDVIAVAVRLPALIEHGDFAKVLVCNAGHVKNVPGCKTDFSDAEWLVHLLECGLLAASFVPAGAVAELRARTRYRKKLIGQRTREWQRLEKLLVRHEALLLSDGGERPSISLPS